MIVYADWHRKFVDVGLRSRERTWRICAADLGLLCCLVMAPDGVFMNYPQLRITWLIGMVEATIEAYMGRGGEGETIMELLRQNPERLLDDAAEGRMNISCGTGAAERMLKEINDSLFKLIKERIFSEEGMKVHRLRKLRELQRQYAEDSANHDFLNADINNIQKNGVIKRRRGKDAEKPLGDKKRMDQVKVFAHRLYKKGPIADSRESVAQFKKEILKMATEFPSGDTEEEWKRDILEYITGGGKFLEQVLMAEPNIITAFENAPWDSVGNDERKQGGRRKKTRKRKKKSHKKTRKRKKKSHKKTRKGRKKKNRK